MSEAHEPVGAGNLLANLPTNLASEALDVLAEGQNVRVERIVSKGHASPNDFWYDQPQTEFVVLLSGEAHLLFEGEPAPRELKPGDYLVIPARCRHRVTWTTNDSSSIWLAVHYDE
jgi:cupin 2 domain-containing protein